MIKASQRMINEQNNKSGGSGDGGDGGDIGGIFCVSSDDAI
jgi:hypothetical protein